MLTLLKKQLVLISIIEAIYVIYFLRFFKTCMCLDKGYILQKIGLNNKYFNHPTYRSHIPISMICPFGHFISIVIVLYLVVRFMLPITLKNILIINLVVLGMIFIGSFMNINAVVYLLPFIIFDLGLNIFLLVKNKKLKD